MTKMNDEVKRAWVAALRSGDYKQGIGGLRNLQDEFCCLGVQWHNDCGEATFAAVTDAIEAQF